jgi:hypothetical protein
MPKALMVRGVALAAIVTIAVRCDDPPRPSALPDELTVTSVTPTIAAAETSTTIFINGTGFQTGASVTLGGPATSATVLSSRSISASTPLRGDGLADVVVTNPDGRSARLPGALTYATLGLKSVSPATGIIGTWLRVSGVGFLVGVQGAIDGTDTRVILENSGSLFALAPPHAPGTVDLKVTNPDGRSATLRQGFTYEPVTVSAGATTVLTNSQVPVSWTAPPGQSAFDWIGLFRVEDANTHPVWYEYTQGAASGTLVFTAPSVPGRYDFRYLVDDDYNDAARSPPFTVASAALFTSPAGAGLRTPTGSRRSPRRSTAR